MKTKSPVFIGTAGWTQRKEQAHLFLSEGSHLERYAAVYNCVEINSSFNRDHLPKSYKRWAETVPRNFKFSVKLSRNYTHDNKLKIVDDHLKNILSGINELGPNLGVLLVQLPPSLKFDAATVERFFKKVSAWSLADIAIEPRHVSWSTPKALSLLNELDLSVVYADPDLLTLPSGLKQKVNYFRLHGTPEIYKSSYSNRFLQQTYYDLINLQSKKTEQNWVIFDNTTYGHATENAFELQGISRQFNMPELTL